MTGLPINIVLPGINIGWTVNHDRKVNSPASQGGGIATKLEVSLTASEPDGVHWISKLAQSAPHSA